MKTQKQLHQYVNRQPFRPFSVRLSNGARYDFKTARDLGAPRNPGWTLVYFGANDLVIIDVENIVEIIDPTR